MGRSRHLNVDCARSQEAYFSKIRAAVHGWSHGKDAIGCPRETCDENLITYTMGRNIVLECPRCGLIYRGDHERLLEYYE